MKKEDLRIVYMGTPDFAVESLRALVEGGYNIVGVITMPDKPVGRHGSVLQASPVKQYALSKGLPVLQPEKLKDEAFLSELRALKADLQIVVAFRMLPEVVWDMPRLGTFNLHASLLPQYRGAAPINWAVINGDTETGATTFFLTHEIDTGKIIRQKHLPIADTDDVGIVHDGLMTMGAGLVLETVDLLLEGKTDAVPQEEFYKDPSELRPAPKIFKETCRIDWLQPVKRVYDFIRGLSPFNLHASLLPQYRGAAPINWAVINGDTETGATTFFLTHEIDTGKIIRQKHLPIADTDDVGIVHDGLMTMGAGLVLETVDLLLEGKTDAVPQEEFYKDPSELRPAPKIFKETCRIDWLQPVKRVYDFIRGLSPYPAAWTEIVSPEGVRTALKIYQAEKRPAAHELPVGTIRTDRKSYIDIAVEDGYLRLLSVQLAGKKRLPVTDFLNGFKQIGEYKVD